MSATTDTAPARDPGTDVERLLVPDLDADPMAGIPPELLDLVGGYDRDTAGGCG